MFVYREFNVLYKKKKFVKVLAGRLTGVMNIMYLLSLDTH